MDLEPSVVLGPRYSDAVRYAADVHAHQRRKDTDVPYVAHLLAVSSLVLEAGGDEDLAVAALLHDSAEDHGGEARLTDVEHRFGERVARLVRACSDSLADEGAPKLDWEVRKRDHLTRLERADPDVLLVWTADKVHNSRSLVTDLEVGRDVLRGFHAAPDRVLWYYEQNLSLAERRGAPAVLVAPLRESVRRLRLLLPLSSSASSGDISRS